MKNPIKSNIALACAITAATLSSASTANTADIEEIVITAKGEQAIGDIIHTAHVLTESDIIAAQVKSIPALLERIAGISARDSGGRGSQTTVFVRGVSASQTIVLIDGVRVGSATLGAAALNSYPIEAIERIEVLKGPFSGIYGADAAGGVIQLFTKKGDDAQKTVSASVGSDGLGEAAAAFGFGNQRNSLHISAQREETDGIDRTSILTGGNDDIDGFEETAFSLGGKVSFSDDTIAKLNVLATDTTVDFDNTFGDGVGNKTDTETLSTALNVTHRFSDSVSWSTTLGMNEDEARTTSSFPSIFITNRDSFGTELNFQAGEQTFVTVGADYYEESVEGSTTFPVSERDNKALFAQLQTTLGAFDFVGSLRSDDNSSYGSNTNGSIAAALAIADNIKLSASYGTAFVAPSFNFLYFPFFGNPDIQPEETENVEVSVKGFHGNSSWRVSAYQTDIENLFSFDPSTFLAANVGEAEIQGLEAEFNTVWLDWQISVQADLLDAKDKLSGLQLDDRAEQSLTLQVGKDFGALSLDFDLRSESGRVDNSGTTEIAGYGLFDVSARYQVTEQLSILANIDNVFDKDYTVNLIGATERYNTEGRQAKLTLRYSF